MASGDTAGWHPALRGFGFRRIGFMIVDLGLAIELGPKGSLRVRGGRPG